eukprot:m51a1_g13298 hypothetical protein (140) ;mRNA; f:521-1087
MTRTRPPKHIRLGIRVAPSPLLEVLAYKDARGEVAVHSSRDPALALERLALYPPLRAVTTITVAPGSGGPFLIGVDALVRVAEAAPQLRRLLLGPLHQLREIQIAIPPPYHDSDYRSSIIAVVEMAAQRRDARATNRDS